MIFNINPDNILKLIKDKTFQKISIVFVLVLTSFFIGRVTVSECRQDVVCKDIIEDRNIITNQLEQQYVKCQEEKTEELKGLSTELNADCADRVNKALGSAEFDENIHCPICVARGICQ
tara:strand:+ start:921 stop:1277 length:357 start_codon:yes stop_codon:yes gene_type:complete